MTYKRPLRTNEPVYDKMIPDKETTIIAAIGLLNKNLEANAHNSFDRTTEDIRINFGGRGVHQCTNSLYNLPDTPDIKAWPPMRLAGEDTFTARIGPTGGTRGYSRITGTCTREPFSATYAIVCVTRSFLLGIGLFRFPKYREKSKGRKGRKKGLLFK